MNTELSKRQFIAEIKEKVRHAQYEALKVVNVHLINLYWEIGKSISEKQLLGWGKSIVSSLSDELKREFPETTGFSTTNLWYMVQFYNEYRNQSNLQPLVGEISWSKHLIILSKCKDNQQREFYILATKKYGWTKDVLNHQIENKTFEKYLLNQTNFDTVLPEKIKNQAYLAVKDHYNFGFLEMSNEHSEYELEQALIQNIRQFLLEIGPDFSFLANQYKLEVNSKEYRIDLLLFHRRLQCLVAIDLKIGEFEPEHKGKMEFYLSVLNDKVKLAHENPSVGIIICRDKNRTIVEYSLQSATLPIGVATYNTKTKLPLEYKTFLPSPETISKKLIQFLQQINEK
jgi:predicted nuclease of restriction endonuclease-like (RecB) superfamily